MPGHRTAEKRSQLQSELRERNAIKKAKKRLSKIYGTIDKLEREAEQLEEWLTHRRGEPPHRRKRPRVKDIVTKEQVEAVLRVEQSKRHLAIKRLIGQQDASKTSIYRGLSRHLEWTQRNRPDAPHLLSK